MGIFDKLFGSRKKEGEVRDESFVTCGVCGKKAKVRLVDSEKKIVLVGPEGMQTMEKENTAFRCQNCGFIICFSCVFSKIGAVGVATCPRCCKEGGPCLFVRGESPS